MRGLRCRRFASAIAAGSRSHAQPQLPSHDWRPCLPWDPHQLLGSGELQQHLAQHGWSAAVRAFAAEAAPQQEAPAQQHKYAELRGVLARNVRGEDPVADGSGKQKALRFGDLPVTAQLFESFHDAAAPNVPLYDVPAWLARCFPSYDTRPKSPFYDWAAWVRQRLPPEQAAVYLALDQQMHNRRRRALLLHKAQWELCRLWDWQHRRLAQGMPLEPSPLERREALLRVEARAVVAAQVARKEAAAELGLARGAHDAAATLPEGGWRQLVRLAEASAHEVRAAEAQARAALCAPDIRGAAVLSAAREARESAEELLKRVYQVAHAARRFMPPPPAPTQPPAPTASMPTDPASTAHGGGAATTDASTLSLSAPQLTPRKLELVAAVTQRLLQLQGALARLSKRAQALVAPHAGGPPPTAPPPPNAAMAGMVTGAGQTGDTVGRAAGYGSGAAAESEAGKGGPSPFKPGAAGPKGGLVAAMQAAAAIARTDFTPEQSALLTSLGLSEDEWTLLRTLRRTLRPAGGTSTLALLDDLGHELERSSRSFRSRVRLGSQGRALEVLQADLAARKAGAKSGGAGAHHATSLYSVALASGGPSTPAQAGGVVVDGGLLARATAASKAAGGQSVAWKDLAVFNAQATLPMSPVPLSASPSPPSTDAGVARGSNGAGVSLTASKQQIEGSLLRPDSPAPFESHGEGLAYRSPYVFDLGLRPPTHMLDLLTDYMHVKYQDVLAQRDAVARLEAAVLPPSPRPRRPAHRPSPHEADEVTRQANRLFDAGDTEGYTQLLAALAEAGHLTSSELHDHATAVARRSLELTASRKLAAAAGAAAATAPSHADRAALLSLLQRAGAGGGDAEAGSAGVAGVPAEAVAEARRAWELAASRAVAGKAGTVGRGGGGALAAAVARVLQRLNLAGAGPSGSSRPATAAAQLPERLAAGQVATWEQACRAWGSFLEAASDSSTSSSNSPASTLVGPSLPEVLLADAELRAARAEHAARVAHAASPVAGAAMAAVVERLQRAEARAAHINAQLDVLYAAFAARRPGGAGGPTWPTPHASGVAGSGKMAAATGPAEAAGRFNAGLDVSDPAQLLGRFLGVASPKEHIKAHWHRVRNALFGPTAPTGASIGAEAATHRAPQSLPERLQWSDAASPWEQLWALLRAAYLGNLTPPSSLSHATTPSLLPAPAGERPQGLLADVVAGADDGVTAEQVEEQRAAARRRRQKWESYCASREQEAADQEQAGTSDGSGGAAGSRLWDAGASAPPYPGARRILRFKQSIMLGASSSLSTTQGLEQRVEVERSTHPLAARMTGYGAPTVLRPDHPQALKVELRVQVRDLADEVGLGDPALTHLLRVAGASRYDETVGELVLEGSRYPTREENRRWCLEQLHLLLHEAHAFQQQQQQAGGATAPAVFLLERPQVVSLLHQQSGSVALGQANAAR